MATFSALCVGQLMSYHKNADAAFGLDLDRSIGKVNLPFLEAASGTHAHFCGIVSFQLLDSGSGKRHDCHCTLASIQFTSKTV